MLSNLAFRVSVTGSRRTSPASFTVTGIVLGEPDVGKALVVYHSGSRALITSEIVAVDELAAGWEVRTSTGSVYRVDIEGLHSAASA